MALILGGWLAHVNINVHRMMVRKQIRYNSISYKRLILAYDQAEQMPAFMFGLSHMLTSCVLATCSQV